MKPLSEYAAILFDLDGTLVDDSQNSRIACAQWAAEIGVPAEPERWVAIEQKWFAAYERGEVTHTGQRYARMREYLRDDSLSEDQCLALLDKFLVHYLAASTAYPDAHEALLRALETGRQVGILTNGATNLQTKKMQAARLWSDSLTMFAAKELGVPKPNPAVYQRVQEALGMSPGEIILIGDHPVNDFLAAQEAGWSAILLDRHGHHPQHPSIASLAQLPWS